ncbi:MAG: alpha/beta fold hydrolase [Anaerolineae bacterium]|nr:alpha/beta fold hydrolase [Anaerolineae bacterium]
MAGRTGFADIDGGRLYYEVSGQGEPVVLLHGFGCDTRLWDDVALALADRYRVVAYDQRGYGRSTLPAAPYAPHDDLATLLDALDIGRAHLVGLSRGGGVALDTTLAHPNRVRSLTLVDSMLGGYRWSAEFRALNSEAAALARDVGQAEAKAYWLRTPLLESTWRVAGAGERCAAMLDDYSGWHWLNADPARSLRPPAIERLAEVTVPTLVVVGENDIADFHHIAARLAADIPGARRVVLPGVGHMSNMEDPISFSQVVIDFLDRLATASEQQADGQS